MQGEGAGKERRLCDPPVTFPTAGTTSVRAAGVPSASGPSAGAALSVVRQCDSPLGRELKRPVDLSCR